MAIDEAKSYSQGKAVELEPLPPSNVDQDFKVQSIAERDDFHLRRVGKVPVLKRRFGFMSMLGFSCTILITWEAELMTLGTLFTNGGYAGCVWAYVITWVGILCVFATMGEMASMAPTSGGQYHWAFMLSPPKYRKFISYIIGWLNVVAWQSATAGIGFLTSSLIQGVASLNYPNYVAERWHQTLIFWACVLVAIFINTVVSRLLPKIEGIVLVLHVLGFFAILIPLLSMAPAKVNASDVFTEFYNGGGWPTTGLSFMLGFTAQCWNFLGADGAVHMSEEIHDASSVVPRVMITTILLNGALGFGMLLAILFCLTDPTTTFEALSPFMTVIQASVGANGGANAMISIVIILAFSTLIAITTTSSRMTWSFARDRGLPGSSFLSTVSLKTSIPVYTVIIMGTIACLLALINIGSTVAFNIVTSVTVNGMFSAYFIGNALFLWRRITGKIKTENEAEDGLRNVDDINLVWGPFRIPEPLGTIVNAFGCLFILIVLFFGFWPAVIDPTPVSMNYASLMVGATLIFSMIYYLIWAKRTYTGPVIQISE